jgi:hypothetical protein
MKYIMFEVGVEDKYRVPIIFSERLLHSAVAAALFPLMKTLGHVAAVSAGETEGLHIDDVKGTSSSMQRQSYPEDAETINNYDRFGGIVF